MPVTPVGKIAIAIAVAVPAPGSGPLVAIDLVPVHGIANESVPSAAAVAAANGAAVEVANANELVHGIANAVVHGIARTGNEPAALVHGIVRANGNGAAVPKSPTSESKTNRKMMDMMVTAAITITAAITTALTLSRKEITSRLGLELKEEAMMSSTTMMTIAIEIE